jgi:gliding motility-associated-like protein
MRGYVKTFIIFSLVLLPVSETYAQPLWVAGTPAIASAGLSSITMNYGLNQVGTVYIIVYNYNNTSVLTSSAVKTYALLRPSGTIVATAVLTIKKADIGKTLQTILNVTDPARIHTIYIVAADSKGKLQSSPVRLNATTLPCPQANAGSGGNECDLNFALNAVPVSGTGVWTKVSGTGNTKFSPNANASNATVTVTVYGTYVFRWTETKGVCKSSDDITVNFYQTPVANAGTGGSECDLNFALKAIPGSTGGTGTWSMTSGTGSASFSPGANSPDAIVTVSEYGTKVFTWTVTNGPCSGSSNVTVNFYQQPVANAGTGGNNCGLDFYFNAIPSVGTGTWTNVSGPGNVTFSPDNHNPSAKVTVTAYGSYVFRWTEVNGDCTSRASITVGFAQQISADAGNGGDECDRNFLLNAVPGTGTGTWSKVSGPGNATFSPNPNQYNATVTVTQSGAYDFAWTEVSSNCTSVDIIRVTFHSSPSISAGPDALVCKGGSIKLQAVGSGTFLWSPAGLLNNPAVSDPVASPTATTVFTVTLTDQWNCRNSDQVTVEVRDIPIANAGPDQTLDFLFETELEASAVNSNETGEWIVLTGSGTFSDKNNSKTTVSQLSLGENKILWRVANQICAESSDTVLIKINDLIIPTLITPNLDGNNDFFVIRGIESFGKTSLNIFNRWGENVYTNDSYANDWDGRDDNSNLLPEDTYFYILKPEKIYPIKGYIVIKR